MFSKRQLAVLLLLMVVWAPVLLWSQTADTTKGQSTDTTLRMVPDHRPVDSVAVKGEWVTWTDSPERTVYYLHGGGTLSEMRPAVASSAANASTSFLADPLHPAEIPGRAFPGAADARKFEAQAEVRTFTSEVGLPIAASKNPRECFVAGANGFSSRLCGLMDRMHSLWTVFVVRIGPVGLRPAASDGLLRSRQPL